jgi:Flp pilus assembly protein TadG
MALRGARDRAGERGQALIEAMFVIPFVLALILLILDFGIALDRREVMVHAVREGARAAASGASVSQVKAAAVDQSEGNLKAFDVSVCYRDDNLNGYLGDVNDSVEVTISHKYQMLVGGISWIGVPTRLDISPTAKAPLLNPVTGATACPPP